MVTITNGSKVFRVPSGAVKVYKSMGFREVTDGEAREVENTDSGEQEVEDGTGYVQDSGRETGGGDEKTQEEIFIEELLEKPLSQWNNNEVKEFVRIKSIDTSGAQKVSQVRDIIKSYLEEQTRNA